MATYLDAIVAEHRSRVSSDHRDVGELRRSVADAPERRPFAEAIVHARERDGAKAVAVIAEIKRRSPLRGDLALGLDPVDLARSYADGGATCLSVLTDGPHFGGSAADLKLARDAVELPVLRKDFTVSAADLYDARAMGADAVLLIVAVLSDEELVKFIALADELELDALTEVHDEDEVERALTAGARIIGVNQRDLHTFAVDSSRATRLAKLIPDDALKIAESGIKSHADIERLLGAGYDAALIGEFLVRSQDRGNALKELIGNTDRMSEEAH
jgi:indole-3-glycerol phosphate synthase